MNNQTRYLRKLGISRKVIHGQSDPENTHSGYAVDRPFEIFKGQQCVTAFASKAQNPMNKKKGPRKARGGQSN